MLGKLGTDQIDAVLSANITGRIGCTDGEKVYVVPVSYAFNGTHIIAHSKEGMKISMMRKHPQVCFQVDEIDDYANWRSVIIWGKYEEITDPRERYYAAKYLVGHLMHRQVSETAGVDDMRIEVDRAEEPVHHPRPIVYRIRIDEKTGRYEEH
ncbi:pyridoxamine 5'-phosphate oxidase family protein [uncultured Chitinophaga sp.]|jgi:Predicted flavin-nucleotide-binding protein|uniref:pyridoxamine 5'-phosphate oxidase family protein n=1 Tax=uncultured Chitinophaga sp. TaxID=339340 RepID=UPI00261AF893|nr:pyridoxamine 5'-phosphate oxidase family protein [uncultured Chitinophaga sp.]